jgi:hypothetical protein
MLGVANEYVDRELVLRLKTSSHERAYGVSKRQPGADATAPGPSSERQHSEFTLVMTRVRGIFVCRMGRATVEKGAAAARRESCSRFDATPSSIEVRTAEITLPTPSAADSPPEHAI